MFARTLAFVVWAGVAGSAVFWGSRLMARPTPVPAQAALASAGPAAAADLTRLFGAAPAAAVAEAPPPAPASARFQLLGVAAPRPGTGPGQGVALIAVDGKPARAYRAGAVIEGDQVLQAVQPRAVQIGPRGGPAALTLELPALPPPATGVPMAALPGQGMPPGLPGNGLPPPQMVLPAGATPLPAGVVPPGTPGVPQADGTVPMVQPGPVVMPGARTRLRAPRMGQGEGVPDSPGGAVPAQEAGANLR